MRLLLKVKYYYLHRKIFRVRSADHTYITINWTHSVLGKTFDTPLDLNWITELCDAGCSSEVVELVVILLLLRLIVQNFFELAWPHLMKLLRRRKHETSNNGHAKHNLSLWMKDYYLNEVEHDGVYEVSVSNSLYINFNVCFPGIHGNDGAAGICCLFPITISSGSSNLPDK